MKFRLIEVFSTKDAVLNLALTDPVSRPIISRL